MKTKTILLFLVLFCAGVLFAAVPRNIVLLIGDGMSTSQRMTADEFVRQAGRPPLVLNRLPFQAMTRTCSASSLVTDSAAAATAIACGEKTNNGALGVDAKGAPVCSCATVAKRAGKKVGLVTTVTINHATPGGFYAHRQHRSEGYGIGLDLLDSDFDYFAGGGLSGHDDREYPGYRGDIYELARKAGYTLVFKDRAAFDALAPGVGRCWYVGADEYLPYSIDAADWAGLPTLAEMTAKGLALLDNAKGFFLMVEGGRIDHAGHANDPGANLRDVLAFDEAVRVAVEFQKTHPDTLVVVTGDHETGGMSMGFEGSGYAFYVERLADQKCSASKVGDFVGRTQPRTLDDLRPFLEANFGFRFSGDPAQDPRVLTPEEKDELAAALAHDLEAARQGLKDDARYDAQKITKLPAAVKRIFSNKCGVGWTSSAHTGQPVITTAGGPGAERFTGFLENTDLARILKEFVTAP